VVEDEGVRTDEHGEAGSDEGLSRSPANLDQSEASRAVHRHASGCVATKPQPDVLERTSRERDRA
jgi:hypothetical protein